MTIEILEKGKLVLKKLMDAQDFKSIISGIYNEHRTNISFIKNKKDSIFEITASNEYNKSTLFVEESEFIFIINTILHMVQDKIEIDKRNFANI